MKVFGVCFFITATIKLYSWLKLIQHGNIIQGSGNIYTTGYFFWLARLRPGANVFTTIFLCCHVIPDISLSELYPVKIPCTYTIFFYHL
jgi:hypothetical protein